MEYRKLSLLYDQEEFYYRASHSDKTKGLVVFLHGLGDSLVTFDKQICYFQSLGYSCLYFDFAGCGENRHLHIAPDNFVEILAQLLQNEQAPIYLVGHSLGGLFALKVAGNETLKDKNIVSFLLEGTFIDCDVSFFRSIDTSIYNSNFVLAESLDKKVVPSNYLDSYKSNLSIMNTDSFVEYVNDVCVNLSDFRGISNPFARKVVYIFGSKSPCQDQRKYLSESHDFKTILVSDCGHWCHQEQPDKINKIILALVEENEK